MAPWPLCCRQGKKKYDLLFQFFGLVQPVLARSLLCPPKHKLDVDRLLGKIASTRLNIKYRAVDCVHEQHFQSRRLELVTASESWTICRPTSHEEAKGSRSPDTRKSECESQLLGIGQKGKQASARYQPSVSSGGARGHLARVAKREWASVGARQTASHSARLEPMKRTCRGQRSTVDGQGKASGYEPGDGYKTGTSSPRQCQVGASASAGGTGNFGVSFFLVFDTELRPCPPIATVGCGPRRAGGAERPSHSLAQKKKSSCIDLDLHRS